MYKVKRRLREALKNHETEENCIIFYIYEQKKTKLKKKNNRREQEKNKECLIREEREGMKT
jgi:hypothetical protein